jgi:hypothetical protein
MTVRLNLEDIIDGLESQSDESHAFLDNGSGAFGRFKDAIHYYDIAEDWYKYRDNALRQIAIDWCQENNIEFDERKPGD